ncbi:Iron-sulfur assembly protein 1 [Pleosporales sp. CAS-2024a]
MAMYLPRSASAFARSTSTLQRIAPLKCPQCLRTFASSAAARQSSKRQMQTATATPYQPHTLQPRPIPPRNAGVPETSIAGGKAGVQIAEGEAQQSEAVAEKPLRPRKFKFGPRKAVMKLSPSAVAHLRHLLNQPEPKLIRIGTKAKGCSGLAYHLEYVDKPSPLDEQVEQDGVKVLIDNKALLNIIGSEMDWLEDKLNERFIFKNPNISEYHTDP